MAERPAAPIDRRKFLGVTAGAAAASTVLNPAKAHATAPGPPHRRRRVRFGVKYVPSNWWFSWSDWDRASIAADLDDIASAIPLGMTATPAQGDAWHNALFATCEKTAPGKVHVSGIDHWPWRNDACWTRDGLAASGTTTANHTWAGWTQVIQRYGSLSVSRLDGRRRHPALEGTIDPRPAVVLESRAADQTYRAARGITDLITLDEK